MFNKIIIKNCKVVSENKITENSIMIEENKIAKLDKNINFEKNSINIDAEDDYISAGFIDLHVNGGRGYDFLNSNLEQFENIVKFHNYHGTTGILPTITAAPINKMIKFLDNLNLIKKDNKSIIGAHLNGPFISEVKRGAIKKEFLKKPKVEVFNKIIKGHEKIIKIMTIAPELENIEKIIELMKTLKIVPSIGHTDATYKDVLKVKKLGVRQFTHFFNAMRGFHHREPGCVGAGLMEKDMTMELSLDGYNVVPSVINFLIEVKGSDYISIVTDATSSAGMEDGTYLLGKTEVNKKGNIVLDKVGNFAGSAITMDMAFKNFVKFTNLSLEKAINVATINPAKVLGVSKHKGSVSEGKDADLIIFDRDLNLKSVMISSNFIRLQNKVIN